MSYINKNTGREISSSRYEDLDYWEKSNYVRRSSGDFGTSAVIGAVTGSALLGGLLGGDIIGGTVGDLLDGDLFD